MAGVGLLEYQDRLGRADLGDFLQSREHDILLRVRARDAIELRDVVLTRLQEIPEVRATQTVLIFEEAEPRDRVRPEA